MDKKGNDSIHPTLTEHGAFACEARGTWAMGRPGVVKVNYTLSAISTLPGYPLTQCKTLVDGAVWVVPKV